VGGRAIEVLRRAVEHDPNWLSAVVEIAGTDQSAAAVAAVAGDDGISVTEPNITSIFHYIQSWIS